MEYTGSASAFSEELATKPEVEALIDKWDSASN
jgi:1-phosphofructokinase